MSELLPPINSRAQAEANAKMFAENTFPGSGVVLGPDKTGSKFQQVVLVLGKTPELRRKRLEVGANTMGRYISTVLFDADGQETQRYDTMRRTHTAAARYDIVSTSDNVKSLMSGMLHRSTRGHYASFRELTGAMEPEDDAPHFTPRVTGVISWDRRVFAYGLSARHKSTGIGTGQILPLQKTPIIGSFRNVEPGVGYMVHTYDGDGDPLPPFSGLPLHMPLQASPKETAEYYWDMLDPAYRVAIAVKALDHSPHTDLHIINAAQYDTPSQS